MSHLLYLNSCDNYPNKCPHICLHLLVKQHSTPPGLESPVRACLIREAYYTDHHHHGNHKFQFTPTLIPADLAQQVLLIFLNLLEY